MTTDIIDRPGLRAGAIIPSSLVAALPRRGEAAAMLFALAMGTFVLIAAEVRAQDETEPGQLALVPCYGCHALGDDSGAGASAPRIGEIVGQPIAGDANFPYTDAMRAFAEEHGVWTEELLDEFLSWPDKVVPGTSMETPGVASEQERRDLIAALKKLPE